MKAIGKVLLVAGIPFLIIVTVNTASLPPSFAYHPNRCTRNCEQHGCLHERMKYESREVLINKWWYRLYRWNVRALDAIPILDYRQANILVYFILYPSLCLFLIYRLFKTNGTAR